MSEKMFKFKKFKSVGCKVRSYNISISKRGAFGLNAGFYDAESIKGYSHAILYYDESAKAIGISFTNSKDAEGAFKITHGNSSGYIVAQSFFLSLFPHSRADFVKYAGKYTPESYDNPEIGKMFYILLKEKLNQNDEDKP